jgi:hypothetical protein
LTKLPLTVIGLNSSGYCVLRQCLNWQRVKLTAHSDGLGNRDFFFCTPGLPITQCDTDPRHHQGRDQGDPTQTKVQSHYNDTSNKLKSSVLPAHWRFSAQLIMKILVGIAFILIIGSLASALVFLMRDKGRSNRTVQALAFRVGFSILLFVLILVAHRLGWIQPTGIAY